MKVKDMIEELIERDINCLMEQGVERLVDELKLFMRADYNSWTTKELIEEFKYFKDAVSVREMILFEFFETISKSETLGGVRLAKKLANDFGYEMSDSFWENLE